ncbi:two-component sensor histidine kinase [Reichenbachiella sp. 5M10]|uniref:sensor histidine kinase n=1 Tax=Reichenbachiella sp. 5M10 TaxID=1889772 RepID=UPI000C1576D2|nr:HAMP domain-containing sensor histidine kinase [Reichenbachiella sp. 5M10]PIB36347.1 two-component sensor histidine kinase [Reichenbachiella sp. 5M10]
MKKARISKGLFLKLSGIFLLLLLSVSGLYFYFAIEVADKHFQEKNQKLNAEIAQHIGSELKPFLGGKLNEKATDDIMHHMMAINPAIEVYLLDTTGVILNYVAPYKKVVLDRVGLDPIYEFLNPSCEAMILGDDPRMEGRTKVFSAAKIEENDKALGYVYVILASEEYDSIGAQLFDSYVLRLGSVYGLITIVAALIIGVVAIYFITRNLSIVIDTVRRFQGGEMSARIEVTKGGEINELAESFNEMADTIVGNIENMKSMENLRRELVGNVSHDLRTPLAVIHGFIETLIIKDEQLTGEEKRKYLDRALDGTERLKKLVEELFELSKLEAKQVVPVKEAFFINELIDDISQKYTLILEEKGLQIIPVHKGKSFMVYADIGLIERVLQNLIDNAVKFTPANGEIRLEINEKKEQIEIKVTDTGKGIPEDQIPFVFDRYHIGDKRVSLDNNSTGLGLAIVKRILEIHDSSIRLTSRMGQGTSFSFELPQYIA